eukprot:scaffold51753_cov30-Prasinocladus_malaysianus.AAC.1
MLQNGLSRRPVFRLDFEACLLQRLQKAGLVLGQGSPTPRRPYVFKRLAERPNVNGKRIVSCAYLRGNEVLGVLCRVGTLILELKKAEVSQSYRAISFVEYVFRLDVPMHQSTFVVEINQPLRQLTDRTTDILEENVTALVAVQGSVVQIHDSHQLILPQAST